MIKPLTDKRHAGIRESAERAFSQHVIECKSRDAVYRTWRCGVEGDSTHAFWITTIPGTLFLTGDVGDLIVSRNYDMLPWCRGSVDSLHYFESKVPHGFQTTEFSFEVLKEWMLVENASYRNAAQDDSDTEAQKHFANFTELCDEVHEEFSFQDAYEHFEGFFDEIPDWNQYTNLFLWCVEAIRWFVTHDTEPVILDPRDIERRNDASSKGKPVQTEADS